MKYSIDEGKTWLEAGSVRVAPPDDKVEGHNVTITLTDEGMVQDIYGSDNILIHTGYLHWEDMLFVGEPSDSESDDD